MFNISWSATDQSTACNSSIQDHLPRKKDVKVLSGYGRFKKHVFMASMIELLKYIICGTSLENILQVISKERLVINFNNRKPVHFFHSTQMAHVMYPYFAMSL